MKTIFIVFTFILFFVSCGKKQNKKSTVSLRFASGAVVSGTPLNGGIIVMGKSKITDQTFTLNGHTTDGMVVELDKGGWDFFALGWEGGSPPTMPYTGNVRCSFQQKDLQNAEESISFDLNLANCTVPLPAPHSFYPHMPGMLANGGNIPYLQISTCNDITSIPGVPSGTECSSGTAKGLGESFMIKTYFGIGPENGHQQPAGHMESGCLNVDSLTELRLPLGDSTNSDGLPTYHLFSFSEASCTGDFIEYRFEQGLVNGPEHPDQSSVAKLVGDNAILFLEHNSLTPSDNGFQHDHFWGSGGDGDVIAPSQPNDYYRITSFSPDNLTINLTAAPAMLNPGDEVMWYVNDVGASVGCGSSPDKLQPGMHGWGRVTSKGATSVTIDHPFNDKGPDTPGSWEKPSAAMLSAATNATSYCSMQLIRVPNYMNFTHDYSTASDTITKPLAYDHVNGVGGIFIIKVKDTFKMDQSTTSVIVKGFGYGMNNRPTPNYSHCTGAVRCYKMGGSHATAGDAGGAAIVIMARNFAVKDDGPGGMDITIRSNGGTLTAGDGLYRDAGDLKIRTENFEFLSNFDFGLRIGANAQNGGTPAIVRLEYCNQIGVGTLPSSSAASGTIAEKSIDTNPPYCN